MIIVSDDLTPIDRKIISAIKDFHSEHIVLQNIAFDSAESIKDMHGNVFVKQRTGKWINANDGKWNTVEVLKCSVCGNMDNRMYRTDNFCPNSGARLEDEK